MSQKLIIAPTGKTMRRFGEVALGASAGLGILWILGAMVAPRASAR